MKQGIIDVILCMSSYKQTVLAQFFTCNFQINKKHTCKLKHFYPYSQKSLPPTSILKNNHIKKAYIQTHQNLYNPFSYLKIITLKKDTYKPENTYVTLFCSYNFLK